RVLSRMPRIDGRTAALRSVLPARLRVKRLVVATPWGHRLPRHGCASSKFDEGASALYSGYFFTSPLRGNACSDIFQPDDMENRTSDESLGNSIGIEIYTDIHRILFDNRHIAIMHIIMTAIAQMDAERFEWTRRNELPDLFRGNHSCQSIAVFCPIQSVSGGNMSFDAEIKWPVRRGIPR